MLGSDVGQRGDSGGHLAQTVTRVLYVEDNPINAKLVERILARIPGTQLVVAGTAAEGLRLAREDTPDLLLLDLHLPDMSGEDVLQVIRSEQPLHSLPVFILSADAAPATRARVAALGANRFLTKPVDVQDVIDAVNESTRARFNQ